MVRFHPGLLENGQQSAQVRQAAERSGLNPDDCRFESCAGHLKTIRLGTLTDYDRLPAATVSFSRRNIFKRDHYTCQYCGDRGSSQLGEGSRSGKSIDNSTPRYQGNRPRRQPGMEELTLDHVIPRAQSGESRWDNCVLACLECNKRKADRTPEQAKMRLKRKPVQPGWNLQYAIHQQRIESWSRFVSEAYWTVELEK